MTTDNSPFVEFTREGPTNYGTIMLRVNQIKTVEQAPSNGSARVVLFEKLDGSDFFWTKEPYAVVRQRVLEARDQA